MHFPLRLALVLCLVVSLGTWTPVFAETRRMAVVVGNNTGGPSDKPLHYAEEDSTKVADVLAQLGDVHAENLFLLKGQSRGELKQVMDRVGQRVVDFRRNPEDRTVLIFYYSGHSDGEALELGGDRVPYTELRSWLAGTRADVRVVILDGCKSGALVQSKGGMRAPPFEIKLSDQLDATGEAMLTSSAADELALESREILGSFFTHHFVSGLRGAADASGDGRITLSEAYQYAFDHTLAATASTGIRQHPGYDYRLAGKGELVLTEISQPSAWLELPEGFERALILLIRRDQVLAELSSGGARRVALAPGEYAVRIWKGTQAYVARVTVVAGEAKKVNWADLKTAASPQVAGKGHTEEPDDGLSGMTPEARLEYLEKYFSVGDELIVTVSNRFSQVDTSFQVYQGRYRKKVDEDEFFKQVGRADLVQSYQNRRTLKWGLLGGGIAVAVVGTAIGLSQQCHIDNPSDPRFDSCVRDTGPITTIIASITLGTLLGGGSFLVNTHPVEADEVRRLADEYNVTLRRKLGSPPEPSPATDSSGVTFQFTPTVSRGGGGLMMGVAF